MKVASDAASPLSGGVKRYVNEKIAYIKSATTDEQARRPGTKTEFVTSERARIYVILLRLFRERRLTAIE